MEQMPRVLCRAAQISGPVWTTEQVRVALGHPGAPISRRGIDDRLRRGTLLALRVAEYGERAFPLWQFRRWLGRWEVVPGLAAVLHAFPETIIDHWTLALWLRQPNPVLDQKAPLELLIENGGVDASLLAAARATAARWAG